MKFVEYQDRSRYRIRAYETHRIKIEQEWINLPCALCASALKTEWHPVNPTQLTIEDLSPLFAEYPAELIIVGRNSQLEWNLEWIQLQSNLNALGMGLEQMQSDAAIRTFNVLTTEERSVWLVLLD